MAKGKPARKRKAAPKAPEKRNEVVAVIEALSAMQRLVVARAKRDQETFQTLVEQFRESSKGQSRTAGNLILDAIEFQSQLAKSYANIFLGK